LGFSLVWLEESELTQPNYNEEKLHCILAFCIPQSTCKREENEGEKGVVAGDENPSRQKSSDLAFLHITG